MRLRAITLRAAALAAPYLACVGVVPATAGVVDFDNLVGGTAVTSQFPGVAFSSSPGFENRAIESTITSSPPNGICTAAVTGGFVCTAETIVEFASPVDEVSFFAYGVNDTGVVARLEVFQNGVSSGSIDVVGAGNPSVPVPLDLREFSGVTRLRIHDISDSYGIGWDDFAFRDSTCADAPVAACVAAARAKLSVDERRAGRERLALKLNELHPVVSPSDFGDPVRGGTRYDVCLYDGAGGYVAGLAVDRAGEVCGSVPCWKTVEAGVRYRDRAGSASGVRAIAARSSEAATGKLRVSASNAEPKGQVALPTGLAAALQGQTAARVQVLASDGVCFEAFLSDVRRADGDRFVAR
jgi:hypothetical protein